MRAIRHLFVAAAFMLAAALSFGDPAYAAGAPTPPSVAVYGGSNSLAVSTTSAALTLPVSTSIYNTALVINDGPAEIFFKPVTGSGTAAVTDSPLPPGACVPVFVGSYDHIDAITSSGSSTMRVSQWNGAPGMSCPANGTSSPSTTVNQGTSPWVTSDSAAQGNIGATNSSAATSSGATSGLNGLFKLIVNGLFGTGTVSGQTPLLNTPTPTNSSGAFSGATVGTSSASVLAASTAKVYLFLQNQSQGATICINFGGAATISGVTCAAGEFTLGPGSSGQPGGGVVFEANFVPSDQIFAIASAASTPLTIGAK